MVYGYARCSTNEKKQDIERQIRDLISTGVDRNNVFCEYESGTKVNRIELARLLGLVQRGDSIISTEVSRITRSTKQLCEIVETAKEKGLRLVLGTFVVDCTKSLDPMTEGMLKMMGVFAELERNMISERVRSGMANAKAKGSKIGRPVVTEVPKKVLAILPLYQDGSITKKDFAKMCDISRPTLYRYLELLGE